MSETVAVEVLRDDVSQLGEGGEGWMRRAGFPTLLRNALMNEGLYYEGDVRRALDDGRFDSH